MKVVINTCFGGFNLSTKATIRYANLLGYEDTWVENEGGLNETVWLVPPGDRVDFDDFYNVSLEERQKMNELYSKQVISNRDMERNDPLLIQVVEELGEEAGGMCAELTIVEIPDDVEWEINEYDGIEHIAEVHRTWR